MKRKELRKKATPARHRGWLRLAVHWLAEVIAAHTVYKALAHGVEALAGLLQGGLAQ